VTSAGGTGIAVRVDHPVEAEVRSLFARVEAEHGRLDLLVNSVAGEDPTFQAHKPLAEIDIEQCLGLMRQAVFSHLLTVKHAAPLMTRRRKGLIVEVTEGDTLSGGASLLLHLVKVTLKHLAFVLAEELRKHKVAVVAVTPGFLRSESMLEAFGVTEANWRDGGKKDPNFLESETPLFIGRCIAALAADPKALARSGEVTSSWELGEQYGVVDMDGRRPDWEALWGKIMPAHRWLQEGFRRECAWLEQLAQRAGRYAGAATPGKALSRTSKGGKP
jgi:NAD(P)-dependent dehydrogenase (short-subunit alcohol dehydrogenase family)